VLYWNHHTATGTACDEMVCDAEKQLYTGSFFPLRHGGLSLKNPQTNAKKIPQTNAKKKV